ncbi:hypothetical protein B0H17DRAFT_61232 [Mycena rosella]|uniref:Uncharacterized protein n=1 Tax=Mycena rosella TaxID=1033263 RepID=A0AAD7GDL7_MYCRO|nr:hypothetical protein B0H17DRAFT_61232 [Mycena rosella]
MRIATRRTDGAWEFADPRAPFTPAIIADAADAALPASRNSSAASTTSDSLDPSSSRHGSPYSHARYGSETPIPGSSSDLLSSSTAASPWGAPTTPHTAEFVRSPRRAVYSPTPSTSASTFLPAPSIISSSSRRSSVVSSNDSFLDLEPSGSIYSNPFLSPAPSATPSRSARWPASPLGTLPASAPGSPEPPAARPRHVESRAARAIRLGYDELDRASAYAEASGNPSSAPSSPQPPMTPAALAKELESRAAREIRRGYERVDRHSEYAEQEDGLPAY